jgi:hypothetical protein
MILLTHTSIEEMERSRQAPDQATEHFPPISMIHIEGDAIGSAVQVGSPEPTRLSVSATSTWTRFARS